MTEFFLVIRSQDEGSLACVGLYDSYEDADKRLQFFLEQARTAENGCYVNHEDVLVCGVMDIVGKAFKSFSIVESGVNDKYYHHVVCYRIVGIYDGDNLGVVL